MKTLLYLVIILSGSFLFHSCQKEPTPPADTDTKAAGTLAKTISGDCAPVVLGGTFVQNTALTSSNYLEVQLNLTAAGDYEILSDTVNGYSFKATGKATTTGTITVRLTASGTPLSAGVNNFTIKFNGSICQAAITVSPSVAVFTFGNAAGVCSGVTVAGTYITGTALDVSNKVSVQVNVTAAGAFTIATNTVNGMAFSYSGTFVTTGPQTVQLAGSGTPAAAGSSVFSTAATGGCTFTIPVTNPAGSLAQLTTTAAYSITCNAAYSGGDITSDGGSPVTARGICYGTAANPTTANTVINNGTGTGTFVCNLTGLTAGATYHVRAFATNSAGTAYGNDISFTTTTGCLPKIYVTGWHDVYNIAGNIRTPKMWVNTTGSFSGTSLPFTLNAGAIEANSIFVSGTDVYVAGLENSTTTLWKNGVAGTMSHLSNPPPQYQSGAKSIYISGSDIYIAGSSTGGVAVVWKNNVPAALSTSTYGSEALSVFVSGTDVYVAGYVNEMVSSNLVSRAVVWKNGVVTTLTSGSANARANSVFVAGSDVYVAGKEGTAAKIWKNGVATPLQVIGSDEAVANSIFVSGTDVYVSGTENDGNSINAYAVLWKNGVRTALTTSGYRNQAYSVFVVGADVYVAGAKSTGGANTYAGIWKNGFFTPVDGGSTDAVAFSVFVKQ